MGSSWALVITKLQQDPAIVAAFNASYPEGITPNTIQDAIATFERSLVTLNSPFDRWLLGDDSALSDEALRGYHLFKSYGCISCHQGQNVGGNMFATMGAMVSGYFTERGGEITESDLGRYNVTGESSDRHMFKVPSLRLAVRQSHFFHDGSSSSLTDAIQTMAHHQLGRNISDRDIAAITAFLEALVGEHPRLRP
jgi:cytochrome c peroxidase